MFRPTGGWISPTSMLIVMITPNHTGSKPAAVMIGRRIGLVIRMIAAGGMKNPHTSRNRLIISISTQRFTCMSAIACASICVR